MTRKTVLCLIIVALWEGAVYIFSADASDFGMLKYQLAARYSARTSFVIFCALLLGTGIYGLKGIYGTEDRRRFFVLFILMLAFNHFIHFIFIVLNYRAQALTLLEGKNFPGALGYMLLMLAPVYLWNKKTLTKSVQLQLYGFFLFIVIIFLVTYVGRFSKELPMMSSPLVYGCFLASMSVLIILNLYRFIKENRSGLLIKR